MVKAYKDFSFQNGYSLGLFLFTFICVLITMILGLKAPGRASNEERFQFAYRRLDGDQPPNVSYGAATSESFGPSDCDLRTSIELVKTMLNAGEIVNEFNRLLLGKTEQRTSVALRSENRSKNRYANILPYDNSRVVLQGSPDGNTYINANNIVMKIPNSNAQRQYIATQGPMESTVCDFWQMIFEVQCETIVMLTDCVESGNAKCHKYWPTAGSSDEHGNLVVSCLREVDPSMAYFSRRPYVVREFSIVNLATQQELFVNQLQFTGWADHDVPRKPQQFVDFVLEVRDRASTAGPIVVHCSAGIGRSGVYILVDYAKSLIDAMQPVRPFDIVRTMREQRFGMIQTAEQMVFACEAILKLFERIGKNHRYPKV